MTAVSAAKGRWSTVAPDEPVSVTTVGSGGRVAVDGGDLFVVLQFGKRDFLGLGF